MVESNRWGSCSIIDVHSFHVIVSWFYYNYTSVFFLKRSIMYIGVRGIYFASVFRILRLDFVSGRVMSCLRFFCVCLCIVVSNTYCVAFLFWFSLFCVTFAASFSGLSIFDCPSVFSEVYFRLLYLFVFLISWLPHYLSIHIS